MIKNVIFDIGGVIVAYKRETYLDPFGFDDETEQFFLKNVIFTPDWTRLSIGEITTAEFINNACSKYPEHKEVIEGFFAIENLKKMIPPFKQTLEFINKLKDKGYRLFVISDMEENTIKYLKTEINGFESMFEDIIYSCRVGMVKKDGNVFDLAIKRFNIDPKESIFIDDVQRNLDQAAKRGINTFRFTDPTVHIKELENMLLD